MAQPSDKPSMKQDLRALPYLFPFLLVFAVFIGYPLLYSFWISLHRVTIYSDFYDIFGTMEYVGFRNYTQVGSDPIFWWSLFLTFAYSVLTVFPGIALSLFLALMLNQKIRGFGLLRSGFYLPNVFDIYVVGVIWLLIYNPQGGPFSLLLRLIGLEGIAEQGMLNNSSTTLLGISIAMVLKNAGFGMILFLVSLNNINESIFEAAEVDGANSIQRLFQVTVPLLKPTILFLIITGTMGSLNAFGEIYAMTDDQGGPSVQIAGTTLSSARTSGYHLFKVFNESMYGEAAAISYFLLVVALSLSLISYRLIGLNKK
ncbi:MAG: carbohydrate ABC transporter permease [Sumerlaeia bacterium]